jgi:uncharacterized protein (DUF3084 family)
MENKMEYKLAHATLRQQIDERAAVIQETKKEIEHHLDEIVNKKNMIRRLESQKYELEQAISQIYPDTGEE